MVTRAKHKHNVLTEIMWIVSFCSGKWIVLAVVTRFFASVHMWISATSPDKFTQNPRRNWHEPKHFMKKIQLSHTTRRAFFVLGGPERGVEEVGQDECQGVEIKLEEVEGGNSKDDCMVGRWWWIFMRATPWTAPGPWATMCVLGHVNSRLWDVYCLHLPSVTVDLIDCKRNPTATTKKLKN